MSLFWDAATCGFFDSTINSDIPENALEITEGERLEALELQATGVKFTITEEDRVQEYIYSEAEIAATELANWVAKRNTLLASATVTVTSGKKFDADETSITRLKESIDAVYEAVELGKLASIEDYSTAWVLAGSESGIATQVTMTDLREAFVLACENRANLWVKEIVSEEV